MFKNCVSLIVAPEIMATENLLPNYCYNSMFYNCTNLTTPPPIIHGYILNQYSCAYMFTLCSSLINPPKMEAYRCRRDSCTSMFASCTSLINTPKLNISSTGIECCQYMFYNCTSLIECNITISQISASVGSFNRMFSGCTSLTISPILAATSLDTQCYKEMFIDCTNLNYVTALFTTDIDSNPEEYGNQHTVDWLKNTSSSGIFVKNINATWTTTGDSGVPSEWTIIYFNPSTKKYYLSDKTTECDDHGNVI